MDLCVWKDFGCEGEGLTKKIKALTCMYTFYTLRSQFQTSYQLKPVFWLENRLSTVTIYQELLTDRVDVEVL